MAYIVTAYILMACVAMAPSLLWSVLTYPSPATFDDVGDSSSRWSLSLQLVNAASLLAPAVMHATVVPDDHAVVVQSSTPVTDAVGVSATLPKFNPEIVTDKPPEGEAFVGA